MQRQQQQQQKNVNTVGMRIFLNFSVTFSNVSTLTGNAAMLGGNATVAMQIGARYAKIMSW